MPALRIPYTDVLPAPTIIPSSASTKEGAVAALVNFLAPGASGGRAWRPGGRTVLLTGAGISVASGLADYRGVKGTYTLNKTYRPIYYNEFCENHEMRKRYWARSFLGWTNLDRARVNRAHVACGELGNMGVVGNVITQNVDSFHPTAHPHLPTIELHGYLRALVCLSCSNEYPRSAFQDSLARLNPSWSSFLAEILASGALDTENPNERRKKGLTTNPDGDVDVPNAPYTTFRYPACPVCAANPPHKPGSTRRARVVVDQDGAWDLSSEAGILKPAVIMFGEGIPTATKSAAEKAVDGADRILVIGSGLATYSAWRLVARAKERGIGIAIVNMGGARGEEAFFTDVHAGSTGQEGVRCSIDAQEVLPEIVKVLSSLKN